MTARPGRGGESTRLGDQGFILVRTSYQVGSGIEGSQDNGRNERGHLRLSITPDTQKCAVNGQRTIHSANLIGTLRVGRRDGGAGRIRTAESQFCRLLP